MESDYRYYSRRAVAEWTAAERAVTPQARERRLHFARVYEMRAAACAEHIPAPLFALSA